MMTGGKGVSCVVVGSFGHFRPRRNCPNLPKVQAWRCSQVTEEPGGISKPAPTTNTRHDRS